MFTVRVHSYPNNEVRATIFRVSQNKPRMSVAVRGFPVSEAAPTALLDITSKVETGLKAISEADSQKSRSGYGLLPRESKFSLYARRQLLRAGAVFDEVPQSECVFLTGTLPGSVHSAFRAIAEWSGYLVHRLKAWIAKRCSAKLDFYVWELQKRGALHLHYVVHLPNIESREFIVSNFKAEWLRLLDTIVLKSGVDLYRKSKHYTHADNKQVTQTKAVTVEKSVARYLSKYLSKSFNSVRGFTKAYCPSRWYGISRELLMRVTKRTAVTEFCYSSHSKAKAKFEEIVHLVESNSVSSHCYSDKFGLASVCLGYYSEEELGHSSKHRLLGILTMKAIQTVSDCHNFRQQLVLTGIRALRSNNNFAKTFRSVIGEFYDEVFSSSATGVSWDTDKQLTFCHALWHVAGRYRRDRDSLPPDLIEWEVNYKSFSDHLSDSDGEVSIQPIEPEEKTEITVDAEARKRVAVQLDIFDG